MSALVVYESHWGNTAAIGRAIATGLGSGTRAVTTSEADGDALASCELLVVGAPLLGFSLPTQDMLESIARPAPGQPAPADVSHVGVREWLASVPSGDLPVTAFETRIWWSPGSAMRAIVSELASSGHAVLAPPKAFIVPGRYGPLRDGETQRAEAWGRELATLLAGP
jgi:hypothetical protein